MFDDIDYALLLFEREPRFMMRDNAERVAAPLPLRAPMRRMRHTASATVKVCAAYLPFTPHDKTCRARCHGALSLSARALGRQHYALVMLRYDDEIFAAAAATMRVMLAAMARKTGAEDDAAVALWRACARAGRSEQRRRSASPL